MSEQTSIHLGELREEIEEEREKGVPMAQYVRESCRLRKELENSESFLRENDLLEE